jgi:hypothetical protein
MGGAKKVSLFYLAQFLCICVLSICVITCVTAYETVHEKIILASTTNMSFNDSLSLSLAQVILELREMWRGQYFGELSIINKTTRTASVVHTLSHTRTRHPSHVMMCACGCT